MTTKTSKLTPSLVLTIIKTHLDACAARLAQSEAKNPGADIAAQRNENSPFCVDKQRAEYIATQGITQEQLDLIFPANGDRNPKVTKRFAQFVYGLHADQFPEIDLTTARALIALREAQGKLNRDALAYLLRGNSAGKTTNANTKGVSLSRIDALVSGRIGRGTVETQLSRSFGSHGFCAALGMVTTAGKTNFEVTLNPDAPMSKRFYALIDAASERKLQQLGNKKGE